jgi:surface protein
MAIPTLAPNCTWFTQGGTSVKRASITQINIVDRYTPTGSETASWDASAAKDGGVMCYVNGTVLTIAGNGSGNIYANEDSSYAFSVMSGSDRFSNLTAIYGADKLDTSNATTFRTMFDRAIKLSEIDVSTWNTENVETMERMFQGCISLTSLNLKNWDVKKVRSMNSMFVSNSSLGPMKLTSIGDVSKWDVSKVENMYYMFYFCQSLKSLDLSGWNTESCTNMGFMFGECTSLNELDIRGWTTENTGSMTNMFANMSSLEKVTLGANFAFKSGATLPTPDPAYIPGADGNWYDSDRNAYAPAAIPSNTARTYYASLEVLDSDKMSFGKTYLIHKMFGKPFAHALTGKWFWWEK